MGDRPRARRRPSSSPSRWVPPSVISRKLQYARTRGETRSRCQPRAAWTKDEPVRELTWNGPGCSSATSPRTSPNSSVRSATAEALAVELGHQSWMDPGERPQAVPEHGPVDLAVAEDGGVRT